MRKTIFSLVVAFVILMTTYSCNKPGNTNSEPTIPIDADLQAAFYYKVGTYWIYRDSISGRVDSFAVRSTKQTSMNVAGNYTLEGISILVTEYNGGSTTDTSAWIINLASNYEELLWFKSLNGAEYFDFDPIFIYPFQTGVPGIIGGSQSLDTVYITNIYPSYPLNGMNYSNVGESYLYYDAGGNHYHYWFYVNDGVGFIKMSIHDTYYNINFVWQLLRANIIK